MSWLVGQAGSAGVRATSRAVLTAKQQAELRDVVREAISSALDDVAADDVDIVREGLLAEAPDSADITAEGALDLREAVLTQLRPRLDALAEQGYPVDADELADAVARRIRVGIRGNAARGGLLAPLWQVISDDRLVAASETTADASRQIAADLRAMSSWAHVATGLRSEGSEGSEGSAPPPPVAGTAALEHAALEHAAPAHAAPEQGGPVPASAPRKLSNLPFRNPHFTGRAEKLAELDGVLSGGPAAVVAVHGLGGVGKTELVLEYAWTRGERYAITWWVHAASAVERAADLVQLSHALGLVEDANTERAIDAVRAELAARSDWLLIFDNVSEPADIRRFLPGGAGSVLITSRLRNWVGVAQTCEVAELTPGEAADYLRRSTRKDVPEIADLAEVLGRLPLALAQAAGYITTNDISVARYLELYAGAAQRLLAEGPPPHGYPETVATTWLLHFKKLSAAAIGVLRLAAFMAPDAIPLGMLLDNALPASLPETLRDTASDPVAREATIGELVGTSLLVRIDDRTFRVHRLVQEIVRAGLDKRASAIWTGHAADLIVVAFPAQPQLYENWSRMSLLTPHAQAVARRIGPHQKAADSALRLLHGVGLYLTGQEQWDMAEEMLRSALRLALFASTTRYEEAGILLALAQIDVGRHDGSAAIEKSTQSLRILERIFGTTHWQLIAPLVTAASNYYGAGDGRQAYEHFDRVADILDKSSEIPPGVLFTALLGLGEGMREVGEYDAAQDNLEQALTLANRWYGERSQSASEAHAYLAWVHHSRGETAAADAELSLAIDITGELYRFEHPYTRRLTSRRERWRAGLE